MELWGIYLTGDRHRDILQAGVKGRGQSLSQVEEVRGLSRWAEERTLKERCLSPGGPALRVTVAGSKERVKDGQMELCLTLHCLHHVAVAFQPQCALLLEKCQGLGPRIQPYYRLAATILFQWA